MKKYIFIIICGLAMSAYFQFANAHEGDFISNGLGYDHIRSLCESGGDDFRRTSFLCRDLGNHENYHATHVVTSAGGIDIIYGGDELLQVGGSGLFNALGSIFLVLFSLVAVFIGFRKLSSLLGVGVGGGGDYENEQEAYNAAVARGDIANADDYDNHGNRLDKENDNPRT